MQVYSPEYCALLQSNSHYLKVKLSNATTLLRVCTRRIARGYRPREECRSHREKLGLSGNTMTCMRTRHLSTLLLLGHWPMGPLPSPVILQNVYNFRCPWNHGQTDHPWWRMKNGFHRAFTLKNRVSKHSISRNRQITALKLLYSNYRMYVIFVAHGIMDK